jgi:hypothetical protein
MAARSPESRTSAYDGSVLRFEADGRSAAAPGWPVLASGYFSPMTIDVDPDGRVWLGSLTAANPSAPVSVLVPGATGEQRSQMRPLSPALRNWPEGATGIRTLVAVAGAGAVAPSLYLVPRGVAGLLVAAASRSLRELTIAQLPLPQIEPTALAALPSGVLVVGGLEPGRPPASAGTLLRLRPAP